MKLLPPGVSCAKEIIDGTQIYNFRHHKLGSLGHIGVLRETPPKVPISLFTTQYSSIKTRSIIHFLQCSSSTEISQEAIRQTEVYKNS